MAKHKFTRGARAGAGDVRSEEATSLDSLHDVQRLVHELQVHQLELEMQNEELRTARLEAEQAREQYTELFRAAPAGYVMLDGEGMIVDCNLAASAMLGRAKQPLMHSRFETYVADADRGRLALHLATARKHRRADCEVSVTLPDGTATIMRLDTSPMPSCSGNCLVVLTDMSERQRYQELLERSNRELESRVTERTLLLESQNRQLQAEIEARTLVEQQRRELEARLNEAERLKSLGMLAAGVAHDFNNLLVGVVGNADVLLHMPDLPDPWRDTLEVIRRTGLEASELTRQLLMFAGQGGMKKTAVDVTEVIAGSVELLRPRFGSDVRATTHFANEWAVIGADRSQLQRVLINLLTNAFESMEGRGAIDVGTRMEALDAAALEQFQYAESARPGEFIVLHVADTGRGIDADAVKRIFEPFFSTKFTGRGLGLATVLGIVQSHGGAIRVRSATGQGTCFEIALPQLAQGEAPAADAQRGRARASQAARPKLLTSGSVLLIDDDDQVRRVVEQLLTAIGLDVKAVSGGAAGLKIYDEQPAEIALVVLDWLMPDMAGDKVLHELRLRDRTLPVILMSGYGSDRLEQGDEHVVCLQKPMTIDDVETAVRRVCAPRLRLAQA